MFSWFKSKDLASVVHARKKVKISGVEFIIKKLDVLNHLEGANVLQKSFDTYQVPKQGGQSQELAASNLKKLREHYTDIICSGVVSPKIGRKEGDGVVYIGDMFTNWDMVNALYQAILEFSYGKKKTK